jgi:hexosaminidase
MKRGFRAHGLVLASAVAALATTATAAHASNPRPLTVPAIRDWTGADGAFKLRRNARIVVPRAYRSQLRKTARDVAADLGGPAGQRIAITTKRGARVRPGDVQLRLGAKDPRLGVEGYTLSAGRTLRIAANTPAGVFYATRTLIQLLRQASTVPAGTARDWPRYPLRGLFVDLGRKYFSPGWLKARIAEMADLKLNELHFHFTETIGWRVASARHPEVVSPKYLTKAQVEEIVALCARNHINVVPEIDMPGHMGAALKKHPELQLAGAGGQRQPNTLDWSKPEARRFARELIEEYLPLFPGPIWDMGADEPILMPLVPEAVTYAPYPQLAAFARARHGAGATLKDGLIGFINEIDELVRKHGKTLRVYNDGLAGTKNVTLNRDIDVEWWDRAGRPPADLLAAGHRISNMSFWPTYYSVGLDFPPKRDPKAVYETWDPHSFRGYDYAFVPAELTISPDEPRNLGSKLSVFADGPDAENEAQIAAAIFPRLRVMAQKTWGTRAAPDYATFAAQIDEVGAP